MICNNLSTCVEEKLNDRKCSCDHPDVCVEVEDTRSNIKCEEKGKSYVLQNPNREKVLLYKIDGGVIVQDATFLPETCKCDYMFTNKERMVVLVELKGKDVSHALDQIDGTLDIFKQFFKSCSVVYGRAVVASATPRLAATPQFTKLWKKLKALNGDLKVSEMHMIENMRELSLS